MPIQYRIDHERRLVLAVGRGIFTPQDAFDYQHKVWSRPDVAGYNELVDMRAVERIAVPSTPRVRELANLSAEMDAGDAISRFAIVAADDLAFGLGRMYEAYREANQRSIKKVGVFRSPAAALEWLGLPAGILDEPGDWQD